MKIAVLASLLKAISPISTGGTEAFAHILTEGLVKEGIDVTLFATSDSETNAKLESLCSSKQTFDIHEGPIAVNMPYEILQASAVVRRSNEFDIIHNNYWHYYSLSSFTPFSACPVITTVHNNFWHKPTLKEILITTHRKGKDIVVFASHAAQKLVENHVDSEVIHHGVDTQAFSFSQTSKEYALWFSRLVPAKGIKHAMDAAHIGNFPLVVAGSPPTKPVNIEFIDTHVKPYFSDTITYAGIPTEDERRALYQNAKVFLFPTLGEEQFGLVMIEAMSCGTPVIGYNRGAVSEIIEDGVTGFIIDPDDVQRPGKGSWIIKKQGLEGLVEAVRRIGEIDRKTCRERVEKHFSRDQMISEYLSLYERVHQRTD
jgi:glycosyltransferase involved in cell wall biosynthesis